METTVQKIKFNGNKFNQLKSQSKVNKYFPSHKPILLTKIKTINQSFQIINLSVSNETLNLNLTHFTSEITYLSGFSGARVYTSIYIRYFHLSHQITEK